MSPGTRTVYVVDDDPDIREALELGLAPLEVTSFVNGAEALRALRAGARPDLVLLDLMMPVLDGWGFLAEVARDPVLRTIPVITMSAAITLEQTAKAHPGVRAHLTKPFMLDAVERLLESLR